MTLDRYLILSNIDNPPPQKSFPPIPNTKLQTFCRSLLQIESLRLVQGEQLKAIASVKEYNELPSNLSDPHILPLLNPAVRQVVESFPLQAAEIVRRLGLDNASFNRMLSSSQTNFLFRWRVQRAIKDMVNSKE